MFPETISQLPVSKWFEVIGEKTIADAILDRIVHDAHRIELKGESMRRKRNVEQETSTTLTPITLLVPDFAKFKGYSIVTS
ncbi:MAG: ATP-binding protein [Mucilaginibacter sp.]|nr:ATP-binding protein [Mucilaginibacter sp.]